MAKVVLRLLASIAVLLVGFAVSACSPNEPSKVELPVKHWPTSGKLVALTFDDGPDPVFTPKLLELLRAKNVPATFFASGAQAQKHPEILRQAVLDGHQVGNHAYSHGDLTKMTKQAAYNEILGTNQILEQAIGKTPQFVRYPFGRGNADVDASAKALGLVGSVGWHYSKQEAGYDDWACASRENTLKFYKMATTPGAVLLMHDSNEATKCHPEMKWLDTYIDWARAQGYEFGMLKVTDKPNKLAGGSNVVVVSA